MFEYYLDQFLGMLPDSIRFRVMDYGETSMHSKEEIGIDQKLKEWKGMLKNVDQRKISNKDYDTWYKENYRNLKDSIDNYQFIVFEDYFKKRFHILDLKDKHLAGYRLHRGFPF